jgi:hypothetical protein
MFIIEWIQIHDDTKFVTIGDTSMTKKPISSPMNKYDATIVTKTKSSQNRHKRLIVTILVSSMTLM